jgi:hypothetical protein
VLDDVGRDCGTPTCKPQPSARQHAAVC